MGRLSALTVKSLKGPGRFSDGDGLYLVVGPTGRKSWICRVQKKGRRRDFGLAAVVIAVGLFCRFLKFYAAYAREVFRTYDRLLAALDEALWRR